MRQIKEPWDILRREKFENRLEKLGWRRAGCYFAWGDKVGDIIIETDDWGIFIYEDGRRLFGLSDEYVDSRDFDHIGPLVQNPFAEKKRYLWLNLATGGYTTKRVVRREECPI